MRKCIVWILILTAGMMSTSKSDENWNLEPFDQQLFFGVVSKRLPRIRLSETVRTETTKSHLLVGVNYEISH